MKKKFIKNSNSYSKVLSVSILALFIVIYALPTAVYFTMSAEAGEMRSRGTTETFYPFQDAYVNEDNPDENTGSSTYLWITRAPNKRTYIQFDFSSIPSGSVITSATLQLYQSDYEGSSDRTYDLYLVNNSWDDETITWNTQLGTTFGDVYTTSAIIDTSQGWKSWDVTFDVNACVNNISLPDHPYHGWMIKDHDEGTSNYQGRQFVSKDFPPQGQEFWPKLEVTYEFPVQNIDTGKTFLAIQEAIDDVETLDGHIICVSSGIFYENIEVYKEIILINGSHPIINGMGGIGINITANNVTIYGFEILNSSDGIYSYETDSCKIIRNTVTNCRDDGIQIKNGQNAEIISNIITRVEDDGIFLESSNFSKVMRNTIYHCTQEGIDLEYSDSNTIIDNHIHENDDGGLEIDVSTNNTITNNTIDNNGGLGIELRGNSTNNSIKDNWVTNNIERGVNITNSNNNTLFNNYFNNTYNAWDDGFNIWNINKTAGINILGESYLGGNFWSDYNGVDINNDGLGDTQIPYTSNGNILYGGDHLPLVAYSNYIPCIENESPVDGSTDTDRPPTELNATITDRNNETMDVYIKWKNHYGEWVIIESYKGVYNGTYNTTNLTGNDWIWGNTTYIWSVHVTDGTTWVNETYEYTTNGSRYDVDNNNSVNFQDAGLVWMYRTTEVPYDGLFDVNQDGRVNFQDAGLTWINRD